MQHRAQVGPDGQQGADHSGQAQRQPRTPVEGRGLQHSSGLWLQWEQTPAGGSQVPKTSPLPGTTEELLLLLLFLILLPVIESWGLSAFSPPGSEQGADRGGPPSADPHGHQEEEPGD